jgi:rRNA maturation protein Nop10
MNNQSQREGSQSLRQKAFLAIFWAFICFLTGLGLTLYVDQRFVLLAILLPAFAGIYTLTLRCKNCGEPMFKRKARIFGIRFGYWGGFTIPKECSRCGTKF